tara:strand:+ start:202 stop:681 length:480 start_codon:yes stop_codon:yes gene_type:complete
MFKIIDNFINMGDLAVLKSVLESNSFPWYFQKTSVKGSSKELDCHFGHNFYLNDNVSSDHIKLLNPIIEKLKVNSLIRVKANLTIKSDKQLNTTPHLDQMFDCKVALYYLNTNNGPTTINNKKVDSVQNRIVIFNSDVKHYSTTCTDKQTRITLNFNYV